MALANYADLQTSVAKWLGRAGDPTVLGVLPDLITLAEVRINYGSSEDSQYPSMPLRCRAMEVSVPIIVNSAVAAIVGGTANAITLTLADFTQAPGACFSFVAAATSTGSVTIAFNGGSVVPVVKGSAQYALTGGEIVGGATFNVYFNGTSYVLMPMSAHVPLPAGYLAMRNDMYFDGSPREYCEFEVPDVLNSLYSDTSVDRPKVFTIEGDAIRFGPPPDALYYLWFEYYQKIPTLIAGTNWLMTQNPNVYLYAALLEAGIFFQHARTDSFYQQFKGAINGLQAQDERDRHSGTTLRIMTDTGNP